MNSKKKGEIQGGRNSQIFHTAVGTEILYDTKGLS